MSWNLSNLENLQTKNKNKNLLANFPLSMSFEDLVALLLLFDSFLVILCTSLQYLFILQKIQLLKYPYIKKK